MPRGGFCRFRAGINARPTWLAEAARAGRLRAGLGDTSFLGQRPGLADLPPVPVVRIRGDEFGEGLTHAELADKANEALRLIQQSEGLINDDAAWLLSINKEGRKKMGRNLNQSGVSLQAVATLRALVRHAVVVERHADYDHNHPFVNAIYRLAGALHVGNQVYRVKLTVKDRADPDAPKKLLHALEAFEIESAPLGTSPTSADLSTLQSAQPTTGRTINVADLLRGAQREDGQDFEL